MGYWSLDTNKNCKSNQYSIDDYSPYKIDTGLLSVLDGKSVTQVTTNEDKVQELLNIIHLNHSMEQ